MHKTKKKGGTSVPPFAHPEQPSQFGSKFNSPALIATQRGPASAILSNVLDPHHFGSVGRAGIFPGVAIVCHPRSQLRHLSVSLGHTVISPPPWLKTQTRKLRTCHGNVKRNFNCPIAHQAGRPMIIRAGSISSRRTLSSSRVGGSTISTFSATMG